jgi:hypothetical protein
MARRDGVAKEPDDVGPIPLVGFIVSFFSSSKEIPAADLTRELAA